MALGSKRVYLAVMKPFGEEGAARVRKHRAQRSGKGFQTVECYDGLDSIVVDERFSGATVLLEDLGNVVANWQFGRDGSCSDPLFPPNGEPGDFGDGRVQAQAGAQWLMGQLDSIQQACAHMVIVGNEVGCDGVTYDPQTVTYQQVLGALAGCVAEACDIVVECVAGIPRVLKAKDAHALPIDSDTLLDSVHVALPNGLPADTVPNDAAACNDTTAWHSAYRDARGR